MHVLLLTPALPYPPHQGGALRNFGLVYGLHEAGHRVTLLSFHDGSLDPASTPLAQLCERIETVVAPQRPTRQRLRDLLLSGRPDLALRLESERFRQRLTALLSEQRFDLVQFEGLEMAGCLPLVRQTQPWASLVYDAHNAESALQGAIFAVDRREPRRWPFAAYSLIQTRRIRRFETDTCRQADLVLAVSDDDARALAPLCPDRPIEVIPNGIFSADYVDGQTSLNLGDNALVFTGKMDYRPNVDAMMWFADRVLPQVRERVPEARLVIVGQRPHPRLEALRDRPGIELTGWVADVRPFLHAAAVYVAPLRMGSGTRLKILEAMATGCAVVATSTAAAGLRDEVRGALVLADTDSSMSTAIVNLLEDARQRAALGQKAQERVRQHYDWSALIPCLLDAYRKHDLG